MSLVQIQGPENLPRPDRNAINEEVNKSLDIIKHRGPDARGTWISSDSQAALGHVRLSIVDLSPDGNQPFIDHDSGICAVVNGELYGAEAYHEQLKNEYKFQGNSDCEIVIALYKHYGRGFMSHLRGEFAFVLWDTKRQLLFAARDRYGIKPLYYTVLGGENGGKKLAVATEMKAFLPYGWKPHWDVDSIRGHSWKCGESTFFKGVKKILPAHYLTYQEGGDIKQTVYWDTDFPDKRVPETRTEAEMVEGVRERLLDSIRNRLRGDVPVGVYLSGGLDSSTVAGMAAHLIKEERSKLNNDTIGDLSRLKCFTVQFDKDSGVDESEIAKRTADWLGVEYHAVHMDEENLAKRFEDAVWFSEFPFPDLNGLGKLALAEKVHSLGMKVMLSGEGSDEHFGGYADFRPDAIQEKDHSWAPSHIPEADREVAFNAARSKTGAIVFGNASYTVPESTAAMVNNTHTVSEIAACGNMPFLPWTDAYLASGGDPETRLAEEMDGRALEAMEKKWHPLHTSQYIWLKSYLPNFILRWGGDNMDMAHSVESRPPFLDHHLTEYVNNLPPSLKMKYDPSSGIPGEYGAFKEKYILREAAKPFLTEEIYSNRKASYVGPSLYKQGGPIHQLYSRLLSKENVERLGFVDWQRAEEFLNRTFIEGDRKAFRVATMIAQFVVLSQRFGVASAAPLPN
ncbi:hypothetical protein VI817_005613 [Penicillium citrinum]|nr:hypothetical protein VI817_005613 [Penicillium citrinum]